MRHIFLAPLAASFGELVQGIGIAAGLRALGDDVLFLAHARIAPLLAEAGLTHGRIGGAMPRLVDQALAAAARLRADSLVLVDVAAVDKVCLAHRLDFAALLRGPVPVVALDSWNLREAGLVWDYGSHSETLDAATLSIARRLVPAPPHRPTVPGAYDALPRLARPSAAERRAARAELGLSDQDRLVLWPSAVWQQSGAHDRPELRQRADALPRLLLPMLERMEVQVLHVAPVPVADASPRYRHVPPVRQEVFARLLACADLLVSFNAAATSLVAGVAARVPIVLGMNDTQRAWPLGLAAFLAPMLVENPFYRCMRIADPLDEAAFSAACLELLGHPEALRAAQDELEGLARRLPSGAAALRALLR